MKKLSLYVFLQLTKHPETRGGINEKTISNITLANDLKFSYATNSPTLMIEGMVLAG